MKYEPPELIDLRANIARGGAECRAGSLPSSDCTAGNLAGSYCTAGTLPGTACTNGTSPH